jgi:hypothetical protein
MQPIKTTNAMNPAPAKGIESFPTPVIDDVVIAEVVNSWKGDYQKLEYGTLWKDVSHAPNQGSFPEHKLVYQQPTSEDGQWIKRIWVNDRVNQDSYNYAIKYSAGSQQHPIYIRTYVVPREGYAPLPDGTPDPLFPTAVLVDEEANRIEGELDSKYVSVTRVYETLPGPEVPTKRYNERGDLETVIVQTVPPFTPPDPDGLLVTGSQVVQEEMGKGVKTTSTVQDHSLLQIKEKKEGLLGETITTDDIVAPSTNPDALSQTIVSSVVEQFSATKARKRTTTSSGPTSLTQKSKDGKLLGDITSTQSVVSPSSNPDAVSSTILSSEVRQVDSGKAIKQNVVINSTPTLSGKQGEQGLLGLKSTVESIVPAGTSEDPLSLSVISSAVEPIDSVRSRKVTVSSLGPLTLSGGQNKDGLLGETTVAESIVTAGSNPDALSQTVVSSVIEPIDSAKSRKVTITSIGPTTLSGGQKKDGLLGETTVTEEIVAAGTEPDTLTETIVSSVVDPIDSTKSKKTTVESTGPIVLETTSLVDSAVGQVQATVAQKIVPIGDTPAGGKFVLQDQINAIDSAKARRETVTVPSYPNLTTYDLDEQLDVVIINERTVIDHNTPYVAPPLVLTSNDRPIDQWKTLRITSRMANLPPTRTEYKTQQFTFPAILDSVVVTSLNLGFGRVPISVDESQYQTGINKYVSVQPNLRAALSVPAPIKIVTTFYSSQPTPDPIFQISTQNISFNGSLFSFNFGDVICNNVTIGPITANSFDMRYSGLSETVTFPSSIPSRSSYQAQIGLEKVIFSDVEYYRSGIWFKRTGYVTLR